ncbi:MAG: hypothetical protein LH477_08730 [Nocardioides sp.]|nr:hypothetical protein [Nocardioides sp.]
MRRRIAWLLVGLAVAMTAVDIAMTATYRSLFSEEAMAQHGFPLIQSAALGCVLLGAVIVSRDDRHVIGWLLTAMGAVGALSLMLEAYSIWVISEGGPGPTALGGILGVTSSVIGGQFAIGGLALMFLLAPDGHLLSRRWRWVAAAAPIGVLCCAVALLAADPRMFDPQAGQTGPLRQLFFTVGFVLINLGLVGAVLSMLIRLRRSRGEERQQLRLIALAVGVLTASMLNTFVAELSGVESFWATWFPVYVAYIVLTLALGVAVLRYRLYDISIFINRAIVVALGTAFAAAGYTVLVVAVGSQVDDRTGSFAISLLGTAVVALAFQPLRRAVIQLANRMAYGPRARPYVALASFSDRLAATPPAEALLPAVADAAGRAVSAQGATVTLDVDGIGAVSADWGQTGRDTAQPYDVPIRSGGATLGHITVLVPKGRSLRDADARLLQALADQSALVFRNTAMETELAQRVVTLDQITHELAESRARIIDADDSARRTLEAAITRDVLPQLLTLPDGVQHARDVIASGTAYQGLDELVDDTNAALDSLRELTRGVFPTQLARTGLGPALRSCLSRSGLAPILEMSPDALHQRFSTRVETAVYFCCAEAVRAMSDRSSVAVATDGRALLLRITGVNNDAMDLQSMHDRISAVDGTLTSDGGVLSVRIPDASVPLAGATL